MSTLSLRRTYRDYINSVLKSCQAHSLDMRCTRCPGKRRRTEIHATKPKAKEVSTPHEWWQFKNSQSRMEQSKSSGGDQRLRTSTLIRDRPDRGWRFYLPSSRQNYTCREKNHFRFHWNISTLPELLIHHWMWCWRKVLTITGMVDGDRELSEMWNWFSQDSQNWVKSHRMDIHGSRGRTDEKTNDPQGPTNYGPEIWKTYVWCIKNVKRNQSGTIEKPKLDNARKARGIYFIVPEDEEFLRKSWRMLVARQKFRSQQQCLVKLHCATVAGKTCRAIGGHKTKIRFVLLKLTNLWESEWKELLTDIMKITSQEKVWIH